MRDIDPIEIKQQVSDGRLTFYVKDGVIYCSHTNCTVKVGEVTHE